MSVKDTATLSYDKLVARHLLVKSVRYTFANIVNEGGTVTWESEQKDTLGVTFINVTITGKANLIKGGRVH
jgi:hypothetical protein